MTKKTKIVATIGPASDKAEVIEELILAGVDVFRLNFSHGSHDYHTATLNKIRAAAKKLNKKIGILQDISGPKIRVGAIKEPFYLKSGDTITISVSSGEADGYQTTINHPEILPLLNAGDQIFFCDGAIRAKVVKTSLDNITASIENEGILSSNKGVNFPNTKLGIAVITQKDREDMAWGAANGVDFMAISFVQSASDMLGARQILKELGCEPKLFAKIEKFDAVENIDSIIEASDGIMVARGDLGIEMPFFKVPSIQKSIIKKANERAKPVITATQMMLSMAKNESATRAEISDVANAVLDGTDAVMLSEESAVGINPAAVVRAMSDTIIETEKIYPYGKFDEFNFDDETDMVAQATTHLAQRLNANAIIAITSSGKSAIKLSRNRTNLPILAVAHDDAVLRTLTIVWGVEPVITVEPGDLSAVLAKSICSLLNSVAINQNGCYVATAGHPAGEPGSTNLIRILKSEQIKYYSNAVCELKG